jgi:hypothetical protein
MVVAIAEKPTNRFMIRSRARAVQRHPEGDWSQLQYNAGKAAVQLRPYDAVVVRDPEATVLRRRVDRIDIRGCDRERCDEGVVDVLRKRAADRRPSAAGIGVEFRQRAPRRCAMRSSPPSMIPSF